MYYENYVINQSNELGHINMLINLVYNENGVGVATLTHDNKLFSAPMRFYDDPFVKWVALYVDKSNNIEEIWEFIVKSDISGDVNDDRYGHNNRKPDGYYCFYIEYRIKGNLTITVIQGSGTGTAGNTGGN